VKGVEAVEQPSMSEIVRALASERLMGINEDL
jgi:hypothetical protein